MPLPHPPGYRPRPQGRVDRRRILLAGVLFSFFAVLLVLLGHRAARAPGSALKPIHPERLLVVTVGAGFCGSFGETMRQLDWQSVVTPWNAGICARAMAIAHASTVWMV